MVSQDLLLDFFKTNLKLNSSTHKLKVLSSEIDPAEIRLIR